MMILPFAACTAEKNPAGGDENGNENGNGGTGNGGQQSEIICPTSVRAGAEGVIQWDGFVEGDVLCLAAKDGDDHQLEIKAITSSGLTFYVPKSVPAGNYMLVLKRETRMELGQIEILPPSCPVSAVSVPSKVACGEVLEITGIGFAEGCAVCLKNAEGEVYTFAAELTDLGVRINIPEDMPSGTYDVYLFQDGLEWLLGTALEVREAVSEAVVKDLVGIRYYYPYEEGIMSMRSWTITRGETITLEIADHTIEADVVTKGQYDLYASEGVNGFELYHDERDESCCLNMSYNRDENGIVQYSDVLRYGKTSPTHIVWTYNEDGQLLAVGVEGNSPIRRMEYADGNLVQFYSASFNYAGELQTNASFALDVVWGYMAIMDGAEEPFVYIPYLLGWHRNTEPVQLPSSIYLPDPADYTGATMLEHQFTYEFDADGYVSKMSWIREDGVHWIEYLY